jgi:hypothetical protein
MLQKSKVNSPNERSGINSFEQSDLLHSDSFSFCVIFIGCEHLQSLIMSAINARLFYKCGLPKFWHSH